MDLANEQRYCFNQSKEIAPAYLPSELQTRSLSIQQGLFLYCKGKENIYIFQTIV